jgi:hypothetical protein
MGLSPLDLGNDIAGSVQRLLHLIRGQAPKGGLWIHYFLSYF